MKIVQCRNRYYKEKQNIRSLYLPVLQKLMSKYEYIPIGEEGVLLQIKGNCKIVFFTFFIGNFSKKSKKEKSAYGKEVL